MTGYIFSHPSTIVLTAETQRAQSIQSNYDKCRKSGKNRLKASTVPINRYRNPALRGAFMRSTDFAPNLTQRSLGSQAISRFIGRKPRSRWSCAREIVDPVILSIISLVNYCLAAARRSCPERSGFRPVALRHRLWAALPFRTS